MRIFLGSSTRTHRTKHALLYSVRHLRVYPYRFRRLRWYDVPCDWEARWPQFHVQEGDLACRHTDGTFGR